LPAQALAASIAARLGAAGNGLQELYEQARAAKYPAVSAAGLPAEVVGLLRRMLQVTESLPYRLGANAAVSWSSVYVRQSVAAPAESRKVRTEEVRIEDGIDGVRVESVRVVEERRVSAWAQPFDEVINQHDHLVIEGGAGLGKTTLGHQVV